MSHCNSMASSLSRALSSDLNGPKQCSVCNRPANCFNFGAMSCDACKMFFRRTMLLNVQYVCRRNNQCFDVNFSCLKTPYCRACRIAKCLNVGMKLNLSSVLEVRNQKENEMVGLIESLLYRDAQREKFLITNFTFENPTLEEVVECKEMSIVVRDPTYEMTSSDWCFFGAYTAAKFLLTLNFMKQLSTRDKTLLLENYSAKATLLFSAIRTMRANSDKMIKPDGNDFFMEFLSKWSEFSLQFTNRVRSMLVKKLIDIGITNEEFILVTVLFFCNPVLDQLSQNAVHILTEQQKTYSSALMQYCMLTYQQNGPSRFTELISLCTVINKYYEDVQYLYWIMQYNFRINYKNLVSNVV